MPFIFLFCLVFTAALHSAEDFDRKQIENRIRPSGQVRIQEEQPVQGEAPLKEQNTESTAPVEEKKRTGEEIYERYCVICHKDGVAGAPKFRDAAGWKTRLEQKNLEEIVETAIKGLNAMPPKGTCMDCSVEDIKAAVQFMLPKS